MYLFRVFDKQTWGVRSQPSLQCTITGRPSVWQILLWIFVQMMTGWWWWFILMMMMMTALSLANVDKELSRWWQDDYVNIPQQIYEENASYVSVQWGDSPLSNLIHDVKCKQTQFGASEWWLFWLPSTTVLIAIDSIHHHNISFFDSILENASMLSLLLCEKQLFAVITNWFNPV